MKVNESFDLNTLVRPNIRAMKPYSSARDEFHGSASVFLDANENPFNAPYNRYPDPMQWELKRRISSIKGINVDNIFLGNGSDEPIDLLIRAFCEPGKDKIITPDPTYGMYQVAADINNVECVKVPLKEDFTMDVNRIKESISDDVKLIYLCSPNNPTGNSLNRADIYEIISSFHGIVVIDEAYIDFSSQPSFLGELGEFPNVVVLQTLSKAWGAAAIRLGMAFASRDIISVLNKIKYPYNVNLLTQEKALEILDEDRMNTQREMILQERERMLKNLQYISIVRKIYPTDANFVLVKVDDADKTYNKLVEEGIIVRNRNKVSLCNGCLRITIGTETENMLLISALKRM